MGLNTKKRSKRGLYNGVFSLFPNKKTIFPWKKRPLEWCKFDFWWWKSHETSCFWKFDEKKEKNEIYSPPSPSFFRKKKSSHPPTRFSKKMKKKSKIDFLADNKARFEIWAKKKKSKKLRGFSKSLSAPGSLVEKNIEKSSWFWKKCAYNRRE